MSVRLVVLLSMLFAAEGAELRVRPEMAGSPRSYFPGDRVHAIAAAEEVHARGGTVALVLPGGQAIGSVPAERAAGLETIDPRSKLSAAIDAAQDSGVYLVLFHADVPFLRAARILLDFGVERIEHPDLLESQWLVRARVEDLSRLVEHDDVAYVFPASEELAAGAPVRGCIGPLIDGGAVAQYVLTVGSGWDGTGKGGAELTYSLAYLTNRLPREQVTGIVERALGEWSRHAALRFSLTADTVARRNLNFLFAERDHGDNYAFDGRGRVLAHTFYPAGVNPEPIAGDLHFDNEEAWSDGGQPDLYSVVLHEIGHALGLGHSDRPGSVMYPYYRTLTTLREDDISALQRLYASASPEAIPGPPAPAAPVAPEAPRSTVDSTRPAMAITSPSTPAWSTSAAKLRIAGWARDDNGVTAVTWQRGGDTGTAQGTTSWSFDLPLLVGTNTVIVRARDAAGNTGWRTVVITRR